LTREPFDRGPVTARSHQGPIGPLTRATRARSVHSSSNGISR
jgi:hypothetical protein